MSTGEDRRDAKLRQMAEVSRRAKRAAGDFQRYERDGLMPSWIDCGFCRGKAIFFRTLFRQHVCCLMCGGQMIAEIKVQQTANLPPVVLLAPLTQGPPYREWSWDP